VYQKHRIEALSDGIFAIVMTLLVLDLKVPAHVVPGHVWEALRGDGESWLAFLITFAISARYWMLQHNVFKLTETYTHQAIVFTFIFLGFVSILPFSSSLVGHYGSDHIVFMLYCANQSAIGFALISKLEYIRRREHLANTLDLAHLRVRLYTISLTMLIGGICAWLFSPKYILIVPAVLFLLMRRVEKVLAQNSALKA